MVSSSVVVESAGKKPAETKNSEWKGERRTGLFASVRRINLQLAYYIGKVGQPRKWRSEDVSQMVFQSDE
jgi:hypothetical protein